MTKSYLEEALRGEEGTEENGLMLISRGGSCSPLGLFVVDPEEPDDSSLSFIFQRRTSLFCSRSVRILFYYPANVSDNLITFTYYYRQSAFFSFSFFLVFNFSIMIIISPYWELSPCLVGPAHNNRCTNMSTLLTKKIWRNQSCN